MKTEETPQRMLFTFRRNGDNPGRRLVEATAERLAQYEVPADVDKQSWFGAEDEVNASLEQLGFPTLDIEGVLATLHVNEVANREMEVLPNKLLKAGFVPSE